MGISNNEFVNHCLELFGTLGAARARRMFGGHGLYVDDLFIALIAAERLYLKVDAQTRPHFEAAGCTAFAFGADGQSVMHGYFSAPDEAIESPPLMQPWARLALAAALRARASRPPAAKRAMKARPRKGAASTAPKKA